MPSFSNDEFFGNLEFDMPFEVKTDDSVKPMAIDATAEIEPEIIPEIEPEIIPEIKPIQNADMPVFDTDVTAGPSIESENNGDNAATIIKDSPENDDKNKNADSVANGSVAGTVLGGAGKLIGELPDAVEKINEASKSTDITDGMYKQFTNTLSIDVSLLKTVLELITPAIVLASKKLVKNGADITDQLLDFVRNNSEEISKAIKEDKLEKFVDNIKFDPETGDMEAPSVDELEIAENPAVAPLDNAPLDKPVVEKVDTDIDLEDVEDIAKFNENAFDEESMKSFSDANLNFVSKKGIVDSVKVCPASATFIKPTFTNYLSAVSSDANSLKYLNIYDIGKNSRGMDTKFANIMRQAVCNYAVLKDYRAISQVPQEFRTNKMINYAVKKNPQIVLNLKKPTATHLLYAVKKTTNPEFFSKIADAYGNTLNKHICRTAVKNNHMNIVSVPNRLMSNNMVIEALKNDYKLVSEPNILTFLKDKPKVVEKIVDIQPDAIKYMPFAKPNVIGKALSKKPELLNDIKDKGFDPKIIDALEKVVTATKRDVLTKPNGPSL